jgi:hypothetical protein
MELPENFNERAFQIFGSNEISEPIIMAYMYLGGIVKFGADSLIISQTELRFMESDCEVLILPMSFGDAIMNSMIEIFRKDVFVQKEFDYEVEGNNMLIKVKEFGNIT